jgi:hypothetical protein
MEHLAVKKSRRTIRAISSQMEHLAVKKSRLNNYVYELLTALLLTGNSSAVTAF